MRASARHRAGKFRHPCDGSTQSPDTDTEAQDGRPRTSRVSSKTLTCVSSQENQTSFAKASYKTSARCQEDLRHLASLRQQHQTAERQLDSHILQAASVTETALKMHHPLGHAAQARPLSSTSIKSNSLRLSFPPRINSFTTRRHLITDRFCHRRQRERCENIRHDLSTKGCSQHQASN